MCQRDFIVFGTHFFCPFDDAALRSTEQHLETTGEVGRCGEHDHKANKKDSYDLCDLHPTNIRTEWEKDERWREKDVDVPKSKPSLFDDKQTPSHKPPSILLDMLLTGMSIMRTMFLVFLSPRSLWHNRRPKKSMMSNATDAGKDTEPSPMRLSAPQQARSMQNTPKGT